MSRRSPVSVHRYIASLSYENGEQKGGADLRTLGVLPNAEPPCCVTARYGPVNLGKAYSVLSLETVASALSLIVMGTPVGANVVFIAGAFEVLLIWIWRQAGRDACITTEGLVIGRQIRP